MSMSPVGFQSQIFGGLISQVLVLKLLVPDVGHKSFAPQVEVLCFELPPNCVTILGVGFMVGFKAFPTLFDMISLLFT